ncbi:uncharacterized protein METZ01_LOCUS44762, partial [marine metagenome]
SKFTTCGEGRRTGTAAIAVMASLPEPAHHAQV